MVLAAGGSAVAVASITAAIVFPLTVAFIKPPWESLGIYTLIVSIAAGLLIIFQHRSNIAKLFRKKDEEEEKKIIDEFFMIKILKYNLFIEEFYLM